MSQSHEIAERLAQVRGEIEKAASRAGRAPDEIELVAVSKTHPAELLGEAVDAGQSLYGESKVQEARAKIPLLPSRLRWHFLGHLQKNKIRQALPLFELLHSVDSLALAEQINRVADEDGHHPRVLLEINIAGEGSKFGIQPKNLKDVAGDILQLPRLTVEGLMTIPPLSSKAEDSRPYFARLRQLKEEVEREFGIKLAHLSMGMSSDFAIGIEEGATLVRVGTRIFGARGKTSQVA